MNKKALNTLEYNKIIEKLTDYASSDGAKNKCKNLLPVTDREEIETAQKNTRDALNRIFKKGSISFSGVSDIRPSLKRLEIGSSLNTTELLRVNQLLTAAKRVKTFGRKERDDTPDDTLDSYFDSIEPLTPLASKIGNAILGENEIADNASPALSSIRKSIAGMNGRIHEQLTKIMNQSSTKTVLQDNVITMRNGRYCLPIKSEAKSSFQGMIHDQSSSGSTLFIEPAAVVNLNNELKELYLKEEKEIEKILAELSQDVFECTHELFVNYKALVTLDFIFAKGELAREHNASMPVFNDEGRIKLKAARHPLLDKNKVVPIDLHLGDDFSLLVVTGPNTGGKTVSLKTVGLLTLMGQAGLHIPARDNSELSIFTEVFADIGDEQSIEQSLSTFSSHMKNIVYILNHADDKSLVLFDELCAGTDPTEGAALAIAILNDLKSKGTITMATTHYSELKVFALSTPGVENASLEFDVKTLSPTYRLLIGVPGKSNAFAISGKLGLSQDVIEAAKSRINEDDSRFEDLLSDLEAKRIEIEKQQNKINSYKIDIEKDRAALKSKQANLENQKATILKKANEEALQILQDAKKFADESIRNMNKYGSMTAPVSEMEKERTALRSKISDRQDSLSIKKKTAEKNHNVPKNLKLGDTVLVMSMNVKGSVHTLPNSKGDLIVQMGILQSKVNINDLVLIQDDVNTTKKKFEKTSAGKIKMSKTQSVSAEINLIGKTVDEALAVLDKYLDDAYIAHLPSVRIVHGKGTGALRNAVHGYLKRQKHVAEYRLAEFGEGDAGVTIATFR
ncbi:MAG: endonuclease MutS2 [Lachnospiraceae bacterium]|nr:endonuclease MutS2 [Lachnospiraceae bacterium]